MNILLIILTSLVLVILIIILIILLTKKQPPLPEVKVDNQETLNQLNYLKTDLAKLPTEIDNIILKNFGSQTEKLTEADQKFLASVRSDLDAKLQAFNKGVQEKLTLDSEQDKKVFTEIGSKIQEITNANKEVLKFGEDVKKLSDVISGGGTKKGKFGEFLLESILEEVYDGTTGLYQTQYSFNGVRPDAVIFLPRDKSNRLFIDAKFTYDNYARIYDEEGKINESAKKLFKIDVKNKIDEIKNKYIINGETIEYAICFFPSDEIYQFINTESDFKDIASYARKNRVVLVSPSTLQPTLHTLKALMIEYKRSQKLLEVNKMLLDLEKDFTLLANRYATFSSTFDALLNKKNPLDITVNKLTNQFERIKSNSDSEE